MLVVNRFPFPGGCEWAQRSGTQKRCPRARQPPGSLQWTGQGAASANWQANRPDRCPCGLTTLVRMTDSAASALLGNLSHTETWGSLDSSRRMGATQMALERVSIKVVDLASS